MRFTFPSLLLGELLVERGLILPLELEDALAEQRATGRRLGEVLVSRGALSGAQLTRALAEQYGVELSAEATAEAAPNEPWQPLGRMLVARETITQAQLDAALEAQRRTGRRLGDILVGDHGVSMLELAAALGAQHGMKVEEGAAAEAVSSRFADDSVYEVKTPGRKSLFTTDSFLEATDFAFEYLAAESPDVLEIVRARGPERERVWECDQRGTPANAPGGIDLYGFDPNAWSGPQSFSER
jgi:hypothetical protein